MSGKAPKGLFVPLVTPFHADESIDYEGYKRVIDYVIEGGMDGVLVGRHHRRVPHDERRGAQGAHQEGL